MFKAKKLFEAKDNFSEEKPVVYGVDRGYEEMLVQVPMNVAMTSTEALMRQDARFSPYPFCDKNYIRHEIHRYDSHSDVHVERCGLTGEIRQRIVHRGAFEDPRYRPYPSERDARYRSNIERG